MAANDSRDERMYSMQLDAKYFPPDFWRLEVCTQAGTVAAWTIIIGFVHEQNENFL
jgi:hypothetical protein